MGRIQGKVEKERGLGFVPGSFLDIATRLGRKVGKAGARIEGLGGRPDTLVVVVFVVRKSPIHRGDFDGPVISQIQVGRHVQGGENEERFIKSMIDRAVAKRFFVVNAPGTEDLFPFLFFRCREGNPIRSEVPFPDTGGVVAFFLEKIGDTHPFRIHQGRGIHGGENSTLETAAPIVATCQDAIPSRSADGRTGVRVRKTHSLPGHLIESRCRNETAMVAHFSHAHVVGEDENDIRGVRSRTVGTDEQ